MIPKFRAWDKVTGTMQDVLAIDFMNEVVEITQNTIAWFRTDELRSFDEVVLMQSTGLFDKNGVEIFDGDLVEHDDEGVTYKACEVVYDTDYCQFCFKWDVDNFLAFYDNLTVIGNVHENPELLEVSK